MQCVSDNHGIDIITLLYYLPLIDVGVFGDGVDVHQMGSSTVQLNTPQTYYLGIYYSSFLYYGEPNKHLSHCQGVRVQVQQLFTIYFFIFSKYTNLEHKAYELNMKLESCLRVIHVSSLLNCNWSTEWKWAGLD